MYHISISIRIDMHRHIELLALGESLQLVVFVATTGTVLSKVSLVAAALVVRQAHPMLARLSASRPLTPANLTMITGDA